MFAYGCYLYANWITTSSSSTFRPSQSQYNFLLKALTLDWEKEGNNSRVCVCVPFCVPKANTYLKCPDR